MTQPCGGAPVIADLLAPGLITVFCGSAAGAVSARLGLPYAGPGNKFWPMLAETGLTPGRLPPQDYRRLLGLGIGLTDLNKTQSGSDRALSAKGDDPHDLLRKIEVCGPRLLAFTAKRPAGVFLTRIFGAGSPPSYGPQQESIGETAIFVLPSPSGLAQYWWDPRWWHALADEHRRLAVQACSPASSARRPARKSG